MDKLFIDYLGTSANNYTRMVTRKALVEVVARIFNLGVRFDYMLVLIGNQAVDKSDVLSLGYDITKGNFLINAATAIKNNLEGLICIS